MAEQKNPRFENVPSGSSVKVNDSGIASAEAIGDGLVKITDRDGRVLIEREDGADAVNMSVEQRQAAIDAAIDESPGKNELNPAHSDFDADAPVGGRAPEKQENVNVVNKDLGVDKSSK